MSNQAKRMAESLTEATTRRGFLGRVARVAGGAAAGMAALLATGSALGAPPETEMKLCSYQCRSGTFVYKEVPINRQCPKKYKGCRLVEYY
jgi:hypothetical protein